MKVVSVVPGPDGHGVVRHATTVTRLLAERGVEVALQRQLWPSGPDADIVHVHFTDALFGPEIACAAEAFASWSSQVEAPVVVTLHDVPGHDPDPARDARRAAGYRRVVEHSQAVIVSSSHEQVDGAHVIALPVLPLAPPGPVPPWADVATVGVLGFVYPGKGHDVVLDAMPPGHRVVALGAASPGHADLVEQLHAQAARRGVELLVTGPLTEPELHAAARAVTVPVAAYRTLGSSASISTWLGVGRRPIVTALPFTLALDPASVTLTDDLSSEIAFALGDPGSTWHQGQRVIEDTAAQHLAVYRSVLA